MTRKRMAEVQAELSAAFPSTDAKDAADIDEILALMKRGMAGGKDMPPSTSRTIKAKDFGPVSLLKLKAEKNEAPFKARNQKSRDDACATRQLILEIAIELNANRRRPWRGIEDLARGIENELAKRGKKRSTRTIRRHLELLVSGGLRCRRASLPALIRFLEQAMPSPIPSA